MRRYPPSSTASAPPALHDEAGFTLIELVVVMFIMATVAGVALLALGDAGRGDKLKAEATRLHDAMQLASEEAEMRGSAIGARIQSGDYSFSIWTGKRWRSLERDEILRTHQLPPGMRLTLNKPEPASEKMDDARPPALVFYTSGESTAFQLGLADSDGNGRYEISGNGYGNFSIEQRTGSP